MITASRRVSATIAFFIPRHLAICIARALSQDHFFERIILGPTALIASAALMLMLGGVVPIIFMVALLMLTR